MPSSFRPVELEHPIERNNFALCVLSKKGELKPRVEPWVNNSSKGSSTVSFDFDAIPGEDVRLFVRHDSPVDASASVSFEGRYLGKWSIARKSKLWHNIACDSSFKFQDSYDLPSTAYKPSTFEIRFQYLSRVTKGWGRDVLAPTVVREPSLKDGPGWVQPSGELMQSQFEVVKEDPFLTFVISMYPPTAISFLPTTDSYLTPPNSRPTTPSSSVTTSSLPSISSVSTTDTSSTASTLFMTNPLSTPSTKPTTFSMTNSRPTTPTSPPAMRSIPTARTLSSTGTLSTTSTLPATRTLSKWPKRPTTSSSLMTNYPTTPPSLLATTFLPSTTSTLSTTSSLFTKRAPSTAPTTPAPGSPRLFLPPSPPITPPSVLRPPAPNQEPALVLPPRYSPSITLAGPAPISQMSHTELQEALSEYPTSSLLLPASLIPGFRGKLPMEDFCRMYGLPEDIPPLLARMGIKDAHGLCSKRLKDLQDKGMAPRSIKMLQLAVIRFSSESKSLILTPPSLYSIESRQ
ncbi:hypothetical protein EI94DRAFT_1806742 [Lactarius quietus]|nr:hypothetical protein EI94DRAFT_1806742 [Lactarius quietus]